MADFGKALGEGKENEAYIITIVERQKPRIADNKALTFVILLAHPYNSALSILC
jgi:hypothetical protein